MSADRLNVIWLRITQGETNRAAFCLRSPGERTTKGKTRSATRRQPSTRVRAAAPTATLYRYVDGGKRYLLGKWPNTPDTAFDPAGTSTIYEQSPPSDAVPDYPSPAHG